MAFKLGVIFLFFLTFPSSNQNPIRGCHRSIKNEDSNPKINSGPFVRFFSFFFEKYENGFSYISETLQGVYTSQKKEDNNPRKDWGTSLSP